jgi:exopolyphosphatase/guanosine-5'-triphosphate,3'-diphosphate pyrophosphatase
VTRRNTLRLSSEGGAAVRVHLGVIDLGSNAIRLQVARVFEDGEFAIIHDEREPVRLGEDVFRTGQLSAAAVERAMQTLARFAATAQRHGAASVRSVATSAVREAKNGLAFAEEVERATGLRIEVISGSHEARLIARGVLSSFGAPDRRVALVDVGGGSTEITVVDRGVLGFSGSLPLGSVRLTEGFCRSDPLLPEDERRLRDHIRAVIRSALDPAKVAPCPTLIGSAGTIGAVANYIRRRPSAPRASGGRLRTSFSSRELDQACATLRGMSLAKRRQTRGIEERRAEIVVAGSILLQEICKRLKARSIKVVRRGLRDGLMLEEIERLGPPVVPPASDAKAARETPAEPARRQGTRESA